MNIISRYILRTHFAPFIFGTFLVMFLFLFQFLLKSIDQLIGKGLSIWIITQLVVLNLSWMLVLAVPMGVLFSTLMAFGSMSAVHEITIIKASGGSLFRMMRPIIVAGILLTLLLFWFNDEVLPEANHRAKVLMMDIKRKKPTFSMDAGKFSTQMDGYVILARSVDSIKGTLEGVTIYDTRNSRNLNIVSADTGIASFSNDMSKLILNLFNGEIHQMVPNKVKTYRKINFDKYKIMMDARGFILDRTDEDVISRSDREMHIRDMQKVVDEALVKESEYSKKIDEQFIKHYNYLVGIDTDTVKQKFQKITFSQDTSLIAALKSVERRVSFLRSTISSELMRKDDYSRKSRQYLVEIHKKYAIPFACLVFLFVGCPLGVMTRGGNFGISAAISLAFYIFYWGCLIGGEKLADRGFLEPALSMWMGNILVMIMGLILVLKVNNESLGIQGKKLIVRSFDSVLRRLKFKKFVKL